MKENENFYSNLYAENEEEVNVDHLFFQRSEIPKLTSDRYEEYL